VKKFNLDDLTVEQKRRLARLLNIGTGDDYPDHFEGVWDSFEDYCKDSLVSLGAISSQWLHCFDLEKASTEMALDYEYEEIDVFQFSQPWQDRFKPWDGKTAIWRK
jgi:hypothetical protein